MAEYLQKIAPDRPQVFNGVEISYGVAPILSTFSNLSTRSSRPQWNLYLINIETIIRDRKDTKTDWKGIARSVLTDCTGMAQYISAYCRFTLPRNSKDRPVICFYLPHYFNMPKLLLKDKLPKGTEERWKIIDEVENIIKKEGWQDKYEETEIIFASVGLEKNSFAHKDLVRDLSKAHGINNFRKTCMVSHVPMDFHLCRYFDNFHIVESYTGAIKEKKDLGKKVFKDENLSFNKYLHFLLGDSKYNKQQVSASGKKQIKELAAKNHWNLLPDRHILQSIVNMRLVVEPRIFTQLDF